eukprot:scaffold11370_cov129-Isochrysis_galbana.AAC.2
MATILPSQVTSTRRCLRQHSPHAIAARSPRLSKYDQARYAATSAPTTLSPDRARSSAGMACLLRMALSADTSAPTIVDT